MVRTPMPRSHRAKIFSIFDALSGLKEALAVQEKQPEPRQSLIKDTIAELNQKLAGLRTGMPAVGGSLGEAGLLLGNSANRKLLHRLP